VGSLLPDDEVSAESFTGNLCCFLMLSFCLANLDETFFSSLVGGGERLVVGASLSSWLMLLLEKCLDGFIACMLPVPETQTNTDQFNRAGNERLKN